MARVELPNGRTFVDTEQERIPVYQRSSSGEMDPRQLAAWAALAGKGMDAAVKYGGPVVRAFQKDQAIKDAFVEGDPTTKDDDMNLNLGDILSQGWDHFFSEGDDKAGEAKSTEAPVTPEQALTPEAAKAQRRIAAAQAVYSFIDPAGFQKGVDDEYKKDLIEPEGVNDTLNQAAPPPAPGAPAEARPPQAPDQEPSSPLADRLTEAVVLAEGGTVRGVTLSPEDQKRLKTQIRQQLEAGTFSYDDLYDAASRVAMRGLLARPDAPAGRSTAAGSTDFDPFEQARRDADAQALAREANKPRLPADLTGYRLGALQGLAAYAQTPEEIARLMDAIAESDDVQPQSLHDLATGEHILRAQQPVLAQLAKLQGKATGGQSETQAQAFQRYAAGKASLAQAEQATTDAEVNRILTPYRAENTAAKTDNLNSGTVERYALLQARLAKLWAETNDIKGRASRDQVRNQVEARKETLRRMISELSRDEAAFANEKQRLDATLVALTKQSGSNIQSWLRQLPDAERQMYFPDPEDYKKALLDSESWIREARQRSADLGRRINSIRTARPQFDRARVELGDVNDIGTLERWNGHYGNLLFGGRPGRGSGGTAPVQAAPAEPTAPQAAPAKQPSAPGPKPPAKPKSKKFRPTW